MSVELKNKTSEAASKMLKSADNSDKLRSSDSGTGGKLKSGLREAVDAAENTSRRRSRQK